MNTDLKVIGGSRDRGSRLIRVPMCPVCPLFVRPDSPRVTRVRVPVLYGQVKSIHNQYINNRQPYGSLSNVLRRPSSGGREFS